MQAEKSLPFRYVEQGEITLTSTAALPEGTKAERVSFQQVRPCALSPCIALGFLSLMDAPGFPYPLPGRRLRPFAFPWHL